MPIQAIQDCTSLHSEGLPAPPEALTTGNLKVRGLRTRRLDMQPRRDLSQAESVMAGLVSEGSPAPAAAAAATAKIPVLPVSSRYLAHSGRPDERQRNAAAALA